MPLKDHTSVIKYVLVIADTELSKFLLNKKSEKGKAWLDKCRTILQKMMLTKPDLIKGTGN